MNVKTDARQMESNIFQKAGSEHEYLAFIGRLIVYLRGIMGSWLLKDNSVTEFLL